MEREIRFMERLADIGKAAAQVVHEIRKPLMLIGGFARQLVNDHTLDREEMTGRKLGIIVDEVRRLETLLNGIRLLTRPPASCEKRSLAVEKVLQETLELLQPMLQDQQVGLELDLEPGTTTVKGDCDQLKQVFLNILHNAVEAMRGKGRIRVSSSVQAETVRILLEDNGPGISAKVKERIFEPFFTTKPQGTGLGLAICRSIIQDHGGTITLDSSPPEGTVFIVELPLERF
jgi:signal transduction histidine kinase